MDTLNFKLLGTSKLEAIRGAAKCIISRTDRIRLDHLSSIVASKRRIPSLERLRIALPLNELRLRRVTGSSLVNAVFSTKLVVVEFGKLAKSNPPHLLNFNWMQSVRKKFTDSARLSHR